MSIIIKTKEQQHQEDLIRLANFRPIDDDFMRVLLKDDLPLAQEILRIILQKDDLVLLSEQPQYDMKRLAEKTRYLKETPKGESEMCKSMEEAMMETRKMEDAIIALKLLKRGKMTFDEIAEDSGLTVEEVTELAKDYNLMPV